VEAVQQRDLCYRIRFGTQGRKSQESKVFAHATQDEISGSQVMLIKDGAWQGYRNTLFQRLSYEGVIPEYKPQYYLEKGVLRQALEICNKELLDMKEIYGGNHDLTVLAKYNVLGILKWKEDGMTPRIWAWK
jgi:hypothetical protein